MLGSSYHYHGGMHMYVPPPPPDDLDFEKWGTMSNKELNRLAIEICDNSLHGFPSGLAAEILIRVGTFAHRRERAPDITPKIIGVAMRRVSEYYIYPFGPQKTRPVIKRRLKGANPDMIEGFTTKR